MSILTSVECARRATAPIVGIPVMGGMPFCIKRELLVQSLKGLTLIDAGIQMTLDGKRESSMLVLYATGEKVQAIRKYVPLNNRYQVKMDLWKWAEAQRVKRLKPVVKMSGRERQIERLRKRLTRLGKPRIPRHPLLPALYPSHYPAGIGQQWAQWKREAKVRRWIQLQARLCKAGKMNTAKLYQVLAERGLTVRKWSDVPTHGGHKYSYVSRSPLKDVFAYLAHLWEFCGLASKPSYYFDPDDTGYEGAKHYQNWLEHLHGYKELESMIQGVEAI